MADNENTWPTGTNWLWKTGHWCKNKGYHCKEITKVAANHYFGDGKYLPPEFGAAEKTFRKSIARVNVSAGADSPEQLRKGQEDFLARLKKEISEHKSADVHDEEVSKFFEQRKQKVLDVIVKAGKTLEEQPTMVLSPETMQKIQKLQLSYLSLEANKVNLGIQNTAAELQEAAVDIILTVPTLGYGLAANGARMAGAKLTSVVGKEMAKTLTKEVAFNGGKFVLREAAQKGGEEVAKAAGKSLGRRLLTGTGRFVFIKAPKFVAVETPKFMLQDQIVHSGFNAVIGGDRPGDGAILSLAKLGGKLTGHSLPVGKNTSEMAKEEFGRVGLALNVREAGETMAQARLNAAVEKLFPTGLPRTVEEMVTALDFDKNGVLDRKRIEGLINDKEVADEFFAFLKMETEGRIDFSRISRITISPQNNAGSGKSVSNGGAGGPTDQKDWLSSIWALITDKFNGLADLVKFISSGDADNKPRSASTIQSGNPAGNTLSVQMPSVPISLPDGNGIWH